MSQIKDDNNAKIGLTGLFAGRTSTPGTTTGIVEEKGKIFKDVKEGLTKEELLETMTDETKTALQKEVQRRQYLKAGRPPKGKEKTEKDYVRMTFLISPEKQIRLREIALQRGLFIKEVLDEGIDLVLEKYKEEGR